MDAHAVKFIHIDQDSRPYKTGQVKYRLWRHPLKSTFIGPYDRGEAELYTGPRIVVIGAWEVHQLAGPS
jgi:hypothetical protein